MKISLSICLSLLLLVLQNVALALETDKLINDGKRAKSTAMTDSPYISTMNTTLSTVVEQIINLLNNNYNIKGLVGDGDGTINCTPAAVDEGNTSVCYITAAEGYLLSSLNDNGRNVLNDVVERRYTIPVVASDHIISAGFTIKSFSVTVDTTGNGAIVCASPISYGNAAICTITVQPGHYLSTLTDNGINVASLVSDGKYLIDNIIADHAVTATFVFAPKAVVGSVGYASLASAYMAAPSFAHILTVAGEMPDNGMDMDDRKSINIDGGYNNDYSSKAEMMTVLRGGLRVRNGKITVNSLRLSN